jgi:hypothetical protein
MGYITERAFVILLLFSFASSTASLLFARSGLQFARENSTRLRRSFFLNHSRILTTTLPDHSPFQKHSVVNFVLRVYHNFAFLMNLFWFLTSGLLVFCFLDATLFSVFFTGPAMIIASFLEQKFWVVASWMINLVYRDHD